MNHDNGGRGVDRVCSNNPDHKVGVIAQRILKVPSLISLWAFQRPNILTYLMNVSCMDDMKNVLSFVCGGKLCPHPTFPMHGETSHVQVIYPVCSVVTLLHGGSSCRFDSLYFNLRKCNIFVTKVSIYMYIHLTK